MSKNNILRILLELVFVVIFNIIFFLFGGMNREISVWISYAFIMLSYLMVILTQFMIKPGKSSVLGLSIYSISTTYFIAEFVVGLIFVFMNSKSWKIPFTIQLVLYGIYLILLISTLMANENTINNMEHQTVEVQYIKNVSSKIKPLVGKLDEKVANKKIEHLYDIIHTSPSHSDLSVKAIENSIVGLVDMLQKAVLDKKLDEIYSIADKIEKNVEERNSILKAKQ